MARPSDREFQLKRKIKELEEINSQLEIQVNNLKKQLDKLTSGNISNNEKKPKVSAKLTCPECESEVKLTELPHANLYLCSKGCGYRKVINK